MSLIPNRFRKEIQIHLLNNYSPATKKSTPLILGIDGAPGDGKTFQCNEVLKELNCSIVSLAASDFGSMYECNASNYIVQKYREAAAQEMPVLVLNDIDTAIGDWGKLTQYTANRQFVLNELMHLCDFPENPHDIPSKRVPIIMTGNDFKRIYAPLIRFGRMNHFEWVPTDQERVEIVLDILYPLSSNSIEKLFDEAEKYYENIVKQKKDLKTPKELKKRLPISFYSQLRSEIVNSYLFKSLDDLGWYKTYINTASMKQDLYERIISEEMLTDKALIEIVKNSINKYLISSFV